MFCLSLLGLCISLSQPNNLRKRLLCCYNILPNKLKLQADLDGKAVNTANARYEKAW